MYDSGASIYKKPTNFWKFIIKEADTWCYNHSFSEMTNAYVNNTKKPKTNYPKADHIGKKKGSDKQKEQKKDYNKAMSSNTVARKEKTEPRSVPATFHCDGCGSVGKHWYKNCDNRGTAAEIKARYEIRNGNKTPESTNVQVTPVAVNYPTTEFSDGFGEFSEDPFIGIVGTPEVTQVTIPSVDEVITELDPSNRERVEIDGITYTTNKDAKTVHFEPHLRNSSEFKIGYRPLSGGQQIQSELPPVLDSGSQILVIGPHDARKYHRTHKNKFVDIPDFVVSQMSVSDKKTCFGHDGCRRCHYRQTWFSYLDKTASSHC